MIQSDGPRGLVAIPTRMSCVFLSEIVKSQLAPGCFGKGQEALLVNNGCGSIGSAALVLPILIGLIVPDAQMVASSIVGAIHDVDDQPSVPRSGRTKYLSAGGESQASSGDDGSSRGIHDLKLTRRAPDAAPLVIASSTATKPRPGRGIVRWRFRPSDDEMSLCSSRGLEPVSVGCDRRFCQTSLVKIRLDRLVPDARHARVAGLVRVHAVP